MLYAAAKGDRRRHARIFRVRLFVFLGILLATPFFFRDTPRLVTIELERRGQSSAEAGVAVVPAILRRERPDLPPVREIGRFVTFDHNRPARQDVWLEQGQYVLFVAADPSKVQQFPLTIAGQDRLVVSYDPSRPEPFSIR